MSDSVRAHRRQPTRLPHPWDSPGKNTGVGCHFLLQCMKVKSESEVTQSCLTLIDPMDCSPPGTRKINGIFQARVLEWDAIAFSVCLLQRIIICCLGFACFLGLSRQLGLQAPLGRDCLSPECQREKAMAPHSSTLAWKIPWMEEPGVLQSRGSLGVGHD